jgi:hypothetical protein
MAHGPVLIRMNGNDLIKICNEMDLTGLETGERVRRFTRSLQHNAILYGLYRRSAVTKATLRSASFGVDYLLALQMSVLGPIEYVNTPIIIYRQRAIGSSITPVLDLELNCRKLIQLRSKQRIKCWAMLALGCYDLLKIGGPGWKDKLAGMISHALTFSVRYRDRLIKEVLFLLVLPIASMSTLLWRLAQRNPFCTRFARLIKGAIQSF